ncbi:metallophosphoesterase [Streptomyces tubercidicus]
MTPRHLQRVLVTTGLHSGLDNAKDLIARLDRARKSSLVVGSGDFFQGTGYHRLGDGSVEHRMLTDVYDVIAPGNHGWHHHLEPELHALTVCANVTDTAGKPLFRRLLRTTIGGRRVAVTTVLGVPAVPARQRNGQQVTDPVQALRRLLLEHHHDTDSWIVLSHSGLAESLSLAEACPFLDVIFTGHSHGEQHEPVRVGETLVLKGREFGLGYAIATPCGSGWTAQPPLQHEPHQLGQ